MVNILIYNNIVDVQQDSLINGSRKQDLIGSDLFVGGRKDDIKAPCNFYAPGQIVYEDYVKCFKPEYGRFVRIMKFLHERAGIYLCEVQVHGKQYSKLVKIKVEIIEIGKNIAMVKTTAPHFIDYIHMGKKDGEWKIYNVIWEPNYEVMEKLKI